MYKEELKELADQMIRRIDFLDGAVKEVSEEALSKGRVLDVRWRGNVHFVLQTYHSDWGWYFAERNGERVSSLYRVGRFDERFYQAVQHFVGEINQGDFGHKRTASERLAEIIEKRQLTSYMNTTKWIEFLQVMTEEMPLKIPYAYRTLFDVDGRNDDLFDTCYCSECFNGHDFKSLEWVKVKPKFCERKYRGRLIEDEEIWHDLEGEFIKGMKKYSIPYEAKDGMYIVYGYR